MERKEGGDAGRPEVEQEEKAAEQVKGEGR